VFKLAVVKFKLVIEVFTLAEVVFKLETEVFKLAVVEFKLLTEVFTLADVDSKFDNLPSCVSFVDLAADAEAIKLPLTIPISVNLVSTLPVYVPKVEF